jgi:anti-sigma regulatory factor (Ser/Thr protein kinase)
LFKRQLRVKTGPRALERLRRRLREVLVLEVRRPEARALILLALEEAAANVVEHGYDGRPGHPLSVTVSVEAGENVTIVLRDRAPVLDVTSLASGDLKELARRAAPRGRGLAMIGMLARSMRHRPRRGGGNELELAFNVEELARRAEETLNDAA